MGSLLSGRAGNHAIGHAPCDLFGSVQTLVLVRVDLPDPLKLAYGATVEVSHHIAPSDQIGEVPIARQPAHVLGYIYPSRYAEAAVSRGCSRRRTLAAPQRAMIGWFGIRGIGSLFYLLLALRHGLEPRIADELVTLTWIVAVAIVAHGSPSSC